MKKQNFLLLLDELLELDPGTVTSSHQLENLESWDSLTVVGFIALVDENFDMLLPAPKMSECKTVGDLVTLLGDKIT